MLFFAVAADQFGKASLHGHGGRDGVTAHLFAGRLPLGPLVAIARVPILGAGKNHSIFADRTLTALCDPALKKRNCLSHVSLPSVE